MAKSNPSSAAAAMNKSNDGDSSSVASSSNAAAVVAVAAVIEDGDDSNRDDDDNGDNGGSVYGWAWVGVCAYAIYRIIYYAYRIRMAAIDEYGPVIHEFDPYFNYRATEVRRKK
jgi:hypothetical protein